MLAGALVRPSIGLMYLYTILRLAENVVNHSGINHPLLTIITLKFLPGRAGIGHHDYHHRYSKYASP